MCIRTTLTMLACAGALYGRPALAQAAADATNQASFRVAFSATCLSFNSTRGRVVSTRFTERNIIAEATGLSPSDRAVNRDFALVYNPAEDSLQVVDAQGNSVVDVIHFGGGAATGDARQTDRFTFMFFPGQTNEFGAETNVFGSALITERANRSTGSAAANRANITGRLQFTLNAGTPLGTTNFNSNSGTNAQICTGIFTTSRRFPPFSGGGVTANTTTTNATGTVTNAGTGINAGGAAATTPIIIMVTPGTTIQTPTGAGTTTTTFGSTTGMLPSLTGTGSLPGLGTSIGTGSATLTPFTTTTPVGLGSPITSTGGATTTGSVTTTPLSPGIAGTTTLPTTTTPVGTTGLNGTTTGVSLPTTGTTLGF
jgi:hypothetical protein